MGEFDINRSIPNWTLVAIFVCTATLARTPTGPLLVKCQAGRAQQIVVDLHRLRHSWIVPKACVALPTQGPRGDESIPPLIPLSTPGHLYSALCLLTFVDCRRKSTPSTFVILRHQPRQPTPPTFPIPPTRQLKSPSPPQGSHCRELQSIPASPRRHLRPARRHRPSTTLIHSHLRTSPPRCLTRPIRLSKALRTAQHPV